MLRAVSNKISVQVITPAILYLCYGLLIMSPWLPSVYAQRKKQTAYVEIQQPFYFVDSFQKPGVVKRVVNRKPSDFFKRPSSGSISSIALWRGVLYFCSLNESKIYQRVRGRERVIFEHKTSIRDIAFDQNGILHFSEASFAKGEGKIYKLIFSKTNRSELLYRVPLKVVDGFWGGDFNFDMQDNLYLSSGYHTPAFIYKVRYKREGKSDSPQNVFTLENVDRVYKDIRGAIEGIAIEPTILQDYIYYTDCNQTIYRLNIRDSSRSVAFSFYEKDSKSRKRRLSDIAFNIRRK